MTVGQLVRRGCLPLFAVPFVLFGLLFVYGRHDTATQLETIRAHVPVTTLAGASGPVLVAGVLEATTPVRSLKGGDVAIAEVIARQNTKGGATTHCAHLAQGLSLRLPTGALVPLAPFVSLTTEIDGSRVTEATSSSRFHVLTEGREHRKLDGPAPGCEPPSGLVSSAPSLSWTESVVALGQKATLLGCAREGVLAPCGDGSDTLSVGEGLSPLRARLAREADLTLFGAIFHGILLAIATVASLFMLPSRPSSRGRRAARVLS